MVDGARIPAVPCTLGDVTPGRTCFEFSLLLLQVSSEPRHGTVGASRAAAVKPKAAMTVLEGEQGHAAHAEASSSSSSGTFTEVKGSHGDYAGEDSYTEAALEPALELTPQRKGKPVEELSAQEANDMTCAICLDQIPVSELCAIKGCDHVYCGA